MGDYNIDTLSDISNNLTTTPDFINLFSTYYYHKVINHHVLGFSPNQITIPYLQPELYLKKLPEEIIVIKTFHYLKTC